MILRSLPDESTDRKRVLLDTNVWRYVVDSGYPGELLRATRSGRFIVQIAPAVVYETLRLRDLPLRGKLIDLMTRPHFQRLMPEAYSESVEILNEMWRLHQSWFWKEPDVTFVTRLEKDWSRKTGGFWVRCRRSPDVEARYLETAEGDMVSGAQDQARHAREEMIEAGWKRNPSMNKTLASFNEPMPGWNGEPVEMWRVDSFIGMTYGLTQPGNAYRDWIAPFVDVDHGLVRSPQWAKFWLHEVTSQRLPRQWMRWAHAFAQRFRRVTSGSPGDTQLFTYFLEADVVLTADKALLDILEECRPFAPCALPDGKLVPAGERGAIELLAFLCGDPANRDRAVTPK